MYRADVSNVYPRKVSLSPGGSYVSRPNVYFNNKSDFTLFFRSFRRYLTAQGLWVEPE